MIPVSLKLQNFTSYGTDSPTLDFSKFHLAAISGSNGAGKSSLIDSITWALWGESRTGNNADKLIRQGQTTMEVEFEFDLENTRYKVVRKRSSKGAGLTSLEFFSGSHNLTEGTIKSTQQKIVDTIHMDYEVFVNSSYLRQGRADEFTLKPAGERKEILANIIGLGNYDQLEEKARESARNISIQIEGINYQLVELEKELSLKEEREKSLTLAEEEAKQAEAEVEEKDKLIKKIQEEEQTKHLLVESLKEKDKIRRAMREELSDISLKVSLKEAAISEVKNILSQKEEIETNYKLLLDLTEQKNLLETKRSDLLIVKNELAELISIVNSREEKRNAEISKITVALESLKTENKALQAHVDHLLSHKDSCPTCGQTIEEDKNKQILESNQTQIQKNNDQILEKEKLIEKYKSYIFEESAKAGQKEIEVKKLEQETLSWEDLNQKILALSKYADAYLNLQKANTSVETHQEAITDLRKILLSKQTQLEELEKELAGLGEYEKTLIEIRNTRAAEEIVKSELNLKARTLRDRAGEAKALITRAEQMQKTLSERQTQKARLTEEKAIYEELALAFGKKGIQALLIETIIPEIEEEANILLDKLTDGRMKVSLVTQREAKTGGTIETLDINISDESGQRTYETYSGGEAFRVNISIRLALSKLLTQRSGAKLQFLIIDEGFGTQDQGGRDRLIEAINLIQESFAKILIITHIEELRDAFPSRIEVIKTNTGSTFQVLS